MTADPTRPLCLLALGDVHLGRRPGHLPEGFAAAELGPEAALVRAVDEALARGVDAVLFAGDVVESSNARFEALRPLEREVRRLVEGGIPVYAVAGNHDVDALPRLADLVPEFTLLGHGGTWESARIGDPSRGVVEVLGWSFPAAQVRESPLGSLDLAPRADDVRARLGLLHADLDGRDSPYAPVPADALRRVGLEGWLLGHVHAPSLAPGPDGVPLGYLGSMVGLDPTETGAHGPWLIQVGADRRVSAEQLPLSPLWWERRTLEVEPDQDPEAVADALAGLAREVAEQVRSVPGARPRALGLRVQLQGRSRRFRELAQWAAAEGWRPLEREVGETTVFLDQVVPALRVAHALSELAAGDDPPGILAQELCTLGTEDGPRQELLAGAREALAEVLADARWRAVDDAAGALSESELVDLLQQAGMSALDALLSQRDEAREAEA